jgi:hypothetical protein
MGELIIDLISLWWLAVICLKCWGGAHPLDLTFLVMTINIAFFHPTTKY